MAIGEAMESSESIESTSDIEAKGDRFEGLMKRRGGERVRETIKR